MRRQGIKLGIFLLSYVCLLMLSACGFHLRGMGSAPRWLNNVAIIVEEDVNRDLAPTFKTLFESYHIEVNDNPDKARYWLVLEEEETKKDIESISSSTTPRQFKVEYTLTFKVQKAHGSDLYPSTEVTVSRIFTLNSDRILGSTFEGNLIEKEIRKEVAMKIMNRLSKANAYAPGPDK